MKLKFQTPLILTGLFLLGGCGATFDYEDLRSKSFEGDRFNFALAREYKTFALYEADQMYDWPDAAYFGRKAIMAAKGETPKPEAPASWRIPSDHRAELIAARNELLQSLNNGSQRSFPALAAKMQVSFDCWVEQQEENWQTDHIKACREGFFAAMTGLEGKAEMRSPVYPTSMNIPARGSEAQSTATKNPTRHTLTFDLDSTKIDDDGLDAITDIVRDLRISQTTTLVIHGHADRAGGRPYNQTLSERRAKTVREAFLAKGIGADRITLQAHGETRPQVMTPDGVPEIRNRRVVIFAGSGPAL